MLPGCSWKNRSKGPYVLVSCRASCDYEGTRCHGNHHMRKSADKITASRKRTSSAFLVGGCGVVSGFVFKFEQETVTGCGGLKKWTSLCARLNVSWPRVSRRSGWQQRCWRERDALGVSHHALGFLSVKKICCTPARCQELCKLLDADSD